MDNLQSAISYLGAVEVAPGRYAFRDKQRDNIYMVVTEAMLSAHCSSWRNGHWMPSWWTPEHRYASVDDDGNYSAGTHDFCRYLTQVGGGRTITADLETGEEVPA